MFKYMNVCNIPCTYTMDKYKIFVISQNEKDLSSLQGIVENGIDRLEEILPFVQKKIFYVKNARLGVQKVYIVHLRTGIEKAIYNKV